MEISETNLSWNKRGESDINQTRRLFWWEFEGVAQWTMAQTEGSACEGPSSKKSCVSFGVLSMEASC